MYFHLHNNLGVSEKYKYVIICDEYFEIEFAMSQQLYKLGW